MIMIIIIMIMFNTNKKTHASLQSLSLWETPDEKSFVESSQGLVQMRYMSNYDWIRFLTSPMAFFWVRTHDLVFTKQTL